MSQKDTREISSAEVDAVTGAAHCGVGVTVGLGGVSGGFWYDGNEDGLGTTYGLRLGGGGGGQIELGGFADTVPTVIFADI